MDAIEGNDCKIFDIDADVYICDDLGLVYSIFHPVKGYDFNQRQGRSTRVTSIEMTGKLETIESLLIGPSWQYNPASLNRLILLVDTQTNAQLPDVDDILQQVAPESNYNPNNRNRFKILYDEQWTLDPYLCDLGNGQLCFNKALKSIRFRVDCDVVTIFNESNHPHQQSINTGSILMLLIGSVDYSGADPKVALNVSMRLLFEDL